jgi:hypothetical protein
MNMSIALVIFGDELHLNLHGSQLTVPMIFTLTCSNQESRNKVKFLASACIPAQSELWGT